MLDLSGVNAKIDRGYEHLQALDSEIGAWLRRYPYGLRTEIQDEGRRHVGFLEIYRQPDSARFGLLIGDCAHNFRAALDHLVLAVASVNLTVDRLAEVDETLAYPICTTADAWNKALSRGRLEGMGTAVLAKIERHQPRHAGDPAAHDLSVLHWIDNRDKHRLVHAVAAYPRVEGINLMEAAATPRLSDIAPGPYEDGAQIYAITTDAPSPEMQVSCDLGVEIQIRDSPRPEEIRMQLTKIGRAVQAIVADVTKAHGRDRADHDAPPAS